MQGHSTKRIVAPLRVALGAAVVLGFACASAAAPFAYVAQDGNLLVVDAGTNAVAALMPGAEGPGVAVHPSGTRVYVTNENDASVSVFDVSAGRLLVRVPLPTQGSAVGSQVSAAPRIGAPTPTQTVIPPIPIGSRPVGIAVGADGARVFVAAVGAVFVLDTRVNEFVDTILLPRYENHELVSEGIALSPDGSRVYVVNHTPGANAIVGRHFLSVLATDTHEILAWISFDYAPIGVAVHPSGRQVFVSTNRYDPFNSRGVIFFIDAETNTYVDAVFHPSGTIGALALSPDGSRLYTGGAFMAVDTKTHEILASGPPTSSRDIAVSPDGSHAYRPLTNVPFTLQTIDTEAGEVRASVQIGCSGRAFGSFVGPANGPAPAPTPPPHGDQPFLYIANALSNSLSAVHVGAILEDHAIPVGPAPARVAVGRDGRRAWVTNANWHTLSVVDTARRTTVQSIEVGYSPFGIAVSPDEGRAYVSLLPFPGAIAVVDLNRGHLEKTIPLAPPALEIALSPDGTRLYAANGDIAVVDTATDTVSTTVPVGGAYALALAPDGLALYAASLGGIAVVDTGLLRVIDTIDVPASRISITPDGAQLYVSNASKSVRVVDIASRSLVGEIPGELFAGEFAGEVAFSLDGQLAFVARTSTVAMVDTGSRAVTAEIPVGCAAAGMAVAPVAIASAPEACAGDCDGDGRVTVEELVRGVPFLTGATFVDQCTVLDRNGDRVVDASEFRAALEQALRGCPK